jgi:hypothetical protein
VGPKASIPNPENMAAVVSPDVVLNWAAGDGALSHDVFFGTDPDAVRDAERQCGDIDGDGWIDIDDLAILASQWLTNQGNPSGECFGSDLYIDGTANLLDYNVMAGGWLDQGTEEFRGNQLNVGYDPMETLEESTTYYWRVDEIYRSGRAKGDVWQFRTGPGDEIILGNTLSETAHDMSFVNASTGTGGLGESYRKLMNVGQDYGGEMTFTMAVDPVTQNYLTIKLWGSDHPTTTERYHNLYLFHDGNKQLGYREMGCDLLPLDRCAADNFYKDRFVYSTYMLPSSMTQGQSSVTLKIQVWGYWWPYGNSWDDCQKRLDEPSRGLYRLYTHTDPFFAPIGERQGTEPAQGPVQPSDGQDNLSQLRNDANGWVAYLLTKGASSIKTGEAMHLARAYGSSWATKYQSSDVLDKIVAVLDYYANAQGQGGNKTTIFGGGNESWWAHGCLGEALMAVYDGLNSRGDLSQTVNFGSGNVTRRVGYADFFADGRDWRASQPQWQMSYTNQVMYVAVSYCAADRAAKMLDPSYAWSDAYCLQQAKKAVGLLPWDCNIGMYYGGYNWVPDIPNSFEDYHVVTSKGLSRELAYVCYYGEVGNLFARMADVMNEPEITAQAIKFVQARAPFQFFENDKYGYQAMRVEAAIGARKNEQIGRVSYNDATLEIGAVLQDPVSARFGQLYIEHNRLDSDILYWRDFDPVRRANNYATVLNLPASDYRFPMGSGQPDFVWTDEENAVVAAKVGEERFYAAMYWITPTITDIARVHYTTPTVDRIANIKIKSEFTPLGVTMTREDNPAYWDDWRAPPPEALDLHSYHAGETLPVAAGQMSGRAEFYELRYGPFLIGMNCKPDESYTFDPVGFESGYDMVSKTTKTSPMTVQPRTTVVFYSPSGWYIPASGVTAAGDNPPNETADKAFDGDYSTKWLDFWLDFSPTGSWIQNRYADDARYYVTEYAITSANDAPERDPRDWTLLGSNDGGESWDMLDSRTGVIFDNRFETQNFSITSPGTYNIYRLKITAVQDVSIANSVQIAEIQLF